MTEEQWDARIRTILNVYDTVEDTKVFREFVVDMIIDDKTRHIYASSTFQERQLSAAGR
jgi:hypothetical protein